MTDQNCDIAIVGSGPAGMGAALYAGRAKRETLLFEKLGPGGQLAEAYDVDNYLGFTDGITGPELTEKMKNHAERFGAEIIREEVVDLIDEGELKRVVTGSNEYRAPVAIIASGASNRKLNVPGEERLAGAGVSYCGTCDGAFFRDKKLVVVGGGDAAMTEAVFLTRFASEIKLVHRRQGLRAEAMNIDKAKRNEKIEFVLDTIVTDINGENKVEGVTLKNVKTDKEWQHECDGVFIFVGHVPNTGYLKTILPQYAGELIPTDMNMETEVKGLYAIGDVRVGSYRQIATAVADGVVAAMHAEKRV
ncbi:MAG: thioredoxin-disulfide reductase [Planctomycetes bacterium]|nr:thioredoxin-disulfide reductase [Planctomycetota bacterium]